MRISDNLEFIRSWGVIQYRVTETAREHGWETSPDKVDPSKCLLLMHAEISEAAEALRRHNPPDDKVPEFSNLEVELADLVIRLMAMSRSMGLRVPEAVIAKDLYNQTRPFKHGGKEF